MKTRFVFLLSAAIVCLNSCVPLLGIGNGPKGSVKNEVSITSRHVENRKDAVKLTCISSAYDESFLTIYLWNNTNERVFIEWENARCQSGKVVFGDDRRILSRGIRFYLFAFSVLVTSMFLNNNHLFLHLTV